MILKALYDYYQRCDGLAPAGMENKEIAFVVVIDKEGNFKRFEDHRQEKDRCDQFLVAKGIGRTSKPIANLFWDNSAYSFGYSDADEREMKLMEKDPDSLTPKEVSDLHEGIPKEKAKNQTCFLCFKEKVEKVATVLGNNLSANSLSLFYKNRTSKDIIKLFSEDPLWNDVRKNLTKNFTFKVEGEVLTVAQDEEILNKFVKGTESDSSEERYAVCLITGEKGPLVETTTATQIPGSQAVAKLVAFQVNSGYDSYGKTKGFNAPITKDAEFAYSTALKHLLAKDSENKFYIGSRTYVFWASSNSDASRKLEQSIFALMGAPVDDNPNRNIEAVKQVFMDIYSGIKPNKEKDRFYILGLAPNSARIAVVYWCEQSVEEFAKHILKHFEDMEIVDSRPDDKKFPYVGVRQMTACITLGGKSSDVQPNLPEAIIKSIMQEIPYPVTLYAACLRRIRAEQKIMISRAAILKAYLNRINDNNNQKLKVMLDKENMNQGYLCGRLFATLEYIQERANNIHTIRERYMNAASATPAAVFSTILNLSNHHIEKLEKGAQIFFEGLKGEIMQKIAANGFPAHLDLNDQGRFFVGYYHQRQEFYKKNETSENEE